MFEISWTPDNFILLLWKKKCSHLSDISLSCLIMVSVQCGPLIWESISWELIIMSWQHKCISCQYCMFGVIGFREQTFVYQERNSGSYLLNIIRKYIEFLDPSLLLAFLVLKPEYKWIIRSTLWLLMPWYLVSPGHQHSWYWVCRVNGFFSSSIYFVNCINLLTDVYKNISVPISLLYFLLAIKLTSYSKINSASQVLMLKLRNQDL